MTAYNATIDVPGLSGELGKQLMAVGHFALTGALVAGDTITFPNILPQNGAKVIYSRTAHPELDTNASPTGTLKVGNTDDDDGYHLLYNVGAPVVAPANGGQMGNTGTGALIGTVVNNRDIVMTVVGVMATSITTGTIFLFVTLEGTAA